MSSENKLGNKHKQEKEDHQNGENSDNRWKWIRENVLPIINLLVVLIGIPLFTFCSDQGLQRDLVNTEAINNAKLASTQAAFNADIVNMQETHSVNLENIQATHSRELAVELADMQAKYNMEILNAQATQSWKLYKQQSNFDSEIESLSDQAFLEITSCKNYKPNCFKVTNNGLAPAREISIIITVEDLRYYWNQEITTINDFIVDIEEKTINPIVEFDEILRGTESGLPGFIKISIPNLESDQNITIKISRQRPQPTGAPKASNPDIKVTFYSSSNVGIDDQKLYRSFAIKWHTAKFHVAINCDNCGHSELETILKLSPLEEIEIVNNLDVYFSEGISVPDTDLKKTPIDINIDTHFYEYDDFTPYIEKGESFIVIEDSYDWRSKPVQVIGPATVYKIIDISDYKDDKSTCNCKGVYSCIDFGIQIKAQACYEQCFEESGDKFNLDLNEDGVACEFLPLGE